MFSQHLVILVMNLETSTGKPRVANPTYLAMLGQHLIKEPTAFLGSGEETGLFDLTEAFFAAYPHRISNGEKL